MVETGIRFGIRALAGRVLRPAAASAVPRPGAFATTTTTKAGKTTL